MRREDPTRIAERLLGSLWRRSLSPKRQPEGFLEDALGAALVQTEAWARMVAYFGWPVPTGSFSITPQDRVEEGRTDLRLRFADGHEVVLELKAGPAPSARQLHRYVAPGVTLIGLATTPRRYAHPAMVGTTTWSDLVRMPWKDPPFAWRQLVYLASTMGVSMPPLGVNALSGLVTAYDAQDQITQWADDAADLAARRLTGEGATFVVKVGKKGRRFRERAHGRHVAWTWPLPWGAHPYAGVWVGISLGPPHRPLLVPGLPDLVLCWQSRPGSALHGAVAADPKMAEATARWGTLTGDAVSRETDSGWSQILARRSTTLLLDHREPGAAFHDWVDSVLQEWETAGISSALRRLVLPIAAAGLEAQEPGPSLGQEDEDESSADDRGGA